MSPYFGWDRAIRRFCINLHCNRSDLLLRREDICMTNKTVDLLKTLAAFAITATFSSVSLAGDFTVLQRSAIQGNPLSWFRRAIS